MPKIKITAEYNHKPDEEINTEGLTNMRLDFEDGTRMHIMPDKMGRGIISILGRHRKPGMVALRINRIRGQANAVNVTSSIKTKGE